MHNCIGPSWKIKIQIHNCKIHVYEQIPIQDQRRSYFYSSPQCIEGRETPWTGQQPTAGLTNRQAHSFSIISVSSSVTCKKEEKRAPMENKEHKEHIMQTNDKIQTQFTLAVIWQLNHCDTHIFIHSQVQFKCWIGNSVILRILSIKHT